MTKANGPAVRTTSPLRGCWKLLPIVIAVLAFATTSAPSSAEPNSIIVENQQPGTTSWQFTDYNISAIERSSSPSFRS
ncbi:MAG: hypothetical protein ABI896_03465 [Actinomycetota bacterium]